MLAYLLKMLLLLLLLILLLMQWKGFFNLCHPGGGGSTLLWKKMEPRKLNTTFQDFTASWVERSNFLKDILLRKPASIFYVFQQKQAGVLNAFN